MTGDVKKKMFAFCERVHNDIAAGFRAECVAPFEELKKASEAVIKWAETDEGHDVMCIRNLRRALSDLLGQGVPAEDTPRVSDEELGRYAWVEVCTEMFRFGASADPVEPCPGYEIMGRHIRAKLGGK